MGKKVNQLDVYQNQMQVDKRESRRATRSGYGIDASGMSEDL